MLFLINSCIFRHLFTLKEMFFNFYSCFFYPFSSLTVTPSVKHSVRLLQVCC